MDDPAKVLLVPFVSVGLFLFGQVPVQLPVQEQADIAAMVRLRPGLETREGGADLMVAADLIPELHHETGFAVAGMTGHDAHRRRGESELTLPLREARTPDLHRRRLREVEQAIEPGHRPFPLILLQGHSEVRPAVSHEQIVRVRGLLRPLAELSQPTVHLSLEGRGGVASRLRGEIGGRR